MRLAKLSEQCERYPDMVKHVKAMAESCKGALSVEQRNLLSVAFKNVIGACRASWRSLRAYEESKEVMDDARLGELAVDYRKSTVETELRAVAADLLSTVDGLLEKEGTGDEATAARVFYLKMKGDYHRYLCELEEEGSVSFSSGPGKDASEAYQEAAKIAAEMEPTNPVRLGLALNMSVFDYEILKEPERAIQTAKMAFDQAISKLDALDDADYKDATLIMQLIRDNLSLWAADQTDGPEDA